jgi:UV DNA damage endonuclease
MIPGNRMRLGLCCIFREEPIQFKSRQAGYIRNLSRREQLDRLSTSVLHNASSLVRALEYCSKNGIGCFRVNSRILPLKSHPELGYELKELPEFHLIMELLSECRKYSQERNIRLTFHPDQFTLLSSPKEHVTKQSIAELEYHAEMAEIIGADVITLHGGGAYGDKKSALERLERTIKTLPLAIRSCLALENDDRVYTPRDLLPICEKTSVPLVYDVHHHRCLPDGVGEEETTQSAINTWDREPLFHLSSPRKGWAAKDIRPHHDFIDPDDVPDCWKSLKVTVEIEAKAKEVAIVKLKQDLSCMAKVA